MVWLHGFIQRWMPIGRHLGEKTAMHFAYVLYRCYCDRGRRMWALLELSSPKLSQVHTPAPHLRLAKSGRFALVSDVLRTRGLPLCH